ncbi:MAG: VanZ family protein [Myxococcales bacterium]|nr:VanZ family protein [Myxococcales bacterium]
MKKRPSLKEIASLWVPPAAYASLLFWLSSRPIPDFVPQFTYSDKILHTSAYAVLGALVARALIWSKWLKAWVSATGDGLWRASGWMGGFYGLTDEIHQSFVPGRTSSLYDAIADTLGAFAGAYLVWLVSRRLGESGRATREEAARGR